jgi:hypothetical protein
LISRVEILGQYGFSIDQKKDKTVCRECVYLEGLDTDTKEKICKVCDDYKMSGKEHIRKFEDIKYTNKELFKIMFDL